MLDETQSAKIERLLDQLWDQKVLIKKLQKEISDMQDNAEDFYVNSPTYIQQTKLINQQLAEIEALKGQLDHEIKQKDNNIQKLESEQYDVDSFEFWEETRKLADNTIKKLKQELELYDTEEDKCAMLLEKLKEFEANNLMLKSQNKELAKKVARGGRKQKFTEQDRTLMKMYRIQGKTIREIAEMFNCSVGIVHKLVNEQNCK